MKASPKRVLYVLPILLLHLSCSLLQEPDYLEVKKTDIPELEQIKVEMSSAFEVIITWRIKDENTEEFANLDEFRVERFATDKPIEPENSIQWRLADSFNVTVSDSMLKDTMDTSSVHNFEYIDTSAVYGSVNYYRITAIGNGLLSYSVEDTAGVQFWIPKPTITTINQKDDWGLELFWTKSPFADGYQVERIGIEGEPVELPVTMDTTLIDASYNPTSIDDLLNDTYRVDGIQPNVEYGYSIKAVANKEGLSQRRSEGDDITGVRLNIVQPEFGGYDGRETQAVNDSTVRLYIKATSVSPETLDSLYIMRKDSEEWSFVAQVDIPSLAGRKYNGAYLLDDNTAFSSDTEYSYKVATKGKVNAVVSDTVSASSLPIPGFTFIEGGDFQYSGNAADTSITSFYISVYEATRKWPPEPGGSDCSNGSSNQNQEILNKVTWIDADAYCKSFEANNPNYTYNGYTFRLPSEAEWEYAASWDIFNGIGYNYPWGANTIVPQNANYINSNDPCEKDEPYLTPVGYYDGREGTIDSHSPFGLYDMGGNVLEWCSDTLSENMARAVLKGGAYFDHPDSLNISKRFDLPKDANVPGVGFRIVMEVP